MTKAGEKLIEHARHLLEAHTRTHAAMQRFEDDGWLGRVRIGTGLTLLLYFLPPILRQLKTAHPHLDINIKVGLTATTLEMLKSNALDLGLCTMPVDDPAFQTTILFTDDLVAILPANIGHIPKTVTPRFLSEQPLILGNQHSALRASITNWLEPLGPLPKPVMELDSVEAVKRVVALGLGASIVPASCVAAGHVPPSTFVTPLSPRRRWQVALVQRRDKRGTEGQKLVAGALLALRQTNTSKGD